MKKLAMILAICLCLGMLTVCFSSCGEEANAGSFEAEADKEFSFLFSGLDRSDNTHPAVQAMNAFESETGRKIEFATSGYDENEQKLMAAITSGKPYDVIHAGADGYPYMAVIGYVQDIEPYCDVKRASMDQEIMNSLFTYQGKIYSASPKGCAKPLVIFYNKNMFENEGVTSPDVLYEKGEWTFDKFKETAMKFTRDTNGDGTYDQWGLAAWYTYAFFSGCGSSVCTIDNEGKYALNLSGNTPMLEALELIHSAFYSDKWVGCEGDNILQSFYQGRNAMLNDYSWSDITIYNAKQEGVFNFEYGVVPFPYSNSNTNKTNSCYADGFAIMTGCDAPYTGGRFLEYLTDYYVKNAEENNAKLDAAHVALYTEMTRNIYNATQFDSAVDSGKELCDAVAGKGMDVQQAIETFSPVYEKMVKNVNKKMANKQEEINSAVAEALGEESK